MKIALTEIDGKSWTGGITYLKNFSGTIKSKLNEKITLCLISKSGNENDKIKNDFNDIINLKKTKWSKFLQI